MAFGLQIGADQPISVELPSILRVSRGRQFNPDPLDLMNEDKLAPFLGTWILDTEDSDFEQGEPPKSATLKIEDNFGMAIFSMNQVAADGEVTNDTFEAVPDGPEVKLGKSGLVDAMRLVFQGDRNLVSEARRGGLTIMKAERELSEDGRTLTVTQTVHLVDVASFKNISVYRRAQ